MGITSSEQGQETLLNRLQYVHSLQDENFGRVDILKFKQPPYEYIMKYVKMFREQDQQFHSELDFLMMLKQKTHKSLVKIHHIESRQGTVKYELEKQMCIIHVKLDIYCNYYNFTLNKAIQKKKINGLRFPQNQLWYVLSTLIDLGRYLQGQGISLGDYRSSDVFLTPQGYYIKIYMLHLYPNNKHNAYFTVLSSKQQLENHLLSPQQLKSIRNCNYQIDFDVYKSDLFAIGMIMLELIYMDDPKFYYNADTFQVNFDRIKYNLARLKGQLSAQMQSILHQCLQEDPNIRYDFKQAAAHIDKIRNRISVAGCIRLVDDEENESRKKQINKLASSSSGFRSLPTGVEHKLLVTPIISYADKKSETSKISPRKQLQNESTSSSSLSYGQRKR